MTDWISVKDKLPEQKVIVCAQLYNGKIIKTMAEYIPRYTIRDDGESSEEITEYNEEKDEYYFKEGWYEVSEYTDEPYYWHVYDTVTHWMQLPANPKL